MIEYSNGDLGEDLIRLSKYHLTVIPYDAFTKVYKISIGDIKVLRTRKERNKRDKQTECVREMPIFSDNRWSNHTSIDFKWKGFIVSFL